MLCLIEGRVRCRWCSAPFPFALYLFFTLSCCPLVFVSVLPLWLLCHMSSLNKRLAALWTQHVEEGEGGRCACTGTGKRETGSGKWKLEIGRVDTRFNGCKQRKRCMPPLTCSACSRAGKNNCQQTWKRDQRILRTISLYAATSAEQSARRAGEWASTWETLFALTPCAGVCVSAESCHIYCLAVPPAVTLLQPLPCSLSASLSYADQRGVGKNPIRRRMCRVWRFKNHRSLFFPSAVCVCVFPFRFLLLEQRIGGGGRQGKCVSIVALRMNHAHFKLIYSTVAF